MTEIVLREVICLDRDGSFRPADYPWLTHVGVSVRAATAGRPDGAAGDAGHVVLELYGPPGDVPRDAATT